MGVSLPVSGAVLAALLSFVIFDGRSRIASVNSFLMPLFTALYIAVTLYVIVSEIEGFFPMLGSIFRGAFGFEAVAGGFSASLMTRALKVGVSKGIFSTEAGMGSSPIAHAAAADTTPHRQGLWGIIETSADTFVISTLTAFAMLLSGTDDIASVFIKGFGAAGGWMTIVFFVRVCICINHLVVLLCGRLHRFPFSGQNSRFFLSCSGFFRSPWLSEEFFCPPQASGRLRIYSMH